MKKKEPNQGCVDGHRQRECVCVCVWERERKREREREWCKTGSDE